MSFAIATQASLYEDYSDPNEFDITLRSSYHSSSFTIHVGSNRPLVRLSFDEDGVKGTSSRDGGSTFSAPALYVGTRNEGRSEVSVAIQSEDGNGRHFERRIRNGQSLDFAYEPESENEEDDADVRVWEMYEGKGLAPYGPPRLAMYSTP